MQTIIFKIPEAMAAKLDELVKEEVFPSRSEALRAAVLILLRKYRKV